MLPKQVKSRDASRNVPTPPALAIINQRIDALKLNPDNPRRRSAQAKRQLKHSIETFDFNVPILVDARGNVICGSSRVEAARELGYEELPTILIDHLDEQRLRAFMIAENRISETGEWKDDILAKHLQILMSESLDFEIEAIGFDYPEIEFRVQSLSADSASDGETDRADCVPEAPDVPISKEGDIWICGHHRVACGNSLDEAVYAVLMAGKRAGMVFTDAPYNCKIPGHVSGKGAVKHPNFAMGCGEMSAEQFIEFLTSVNLWIAKHTVLGAVIYQCMDFRHMPELLTAAAGAKFEHLNTCVWIKHNAGMGSFYRSQYENVAVFKNGKGRHRNNVQLGKYGRHRSNVWHYRGANVFGGQTDEGNLLALHPTVKPVALVQDAILDCSVIGDIVLDPFLGVGTVLIAAERSGRRCFGIEISPTYVDRTIRRWQTYCGSEARHAVTNKTFAETARERTALTD